MRFIQFSILPLAFIALLACQHNAQQPEVAAVAEQPPAAAPAAVVATRDSVPQDSVIVILNNDEFYKLTQNRSDVNLVDVRTPYEFQQRHMPGAQNIDFQDKGFQKNIGKLSRQKPVAIYCGTSIRSREAAKLMKAMGFSHIYILEYGLRGWSRPMTVGE